jgi:hypothetical protein
MSENQSLKKNLVAFAANAKSFCENISLAMITVTNLSREGSPARTRQNHTPASVEVESNLDWRAE